MSRGFKPREDWSLFAEIYPQGACQITYICPHRTWPRGVGSNATAPDPRTKSQNDGGSPIHYLSRRTRPLALALITHTAPRRNMNNEIELISDGDGLAVIGKRTAVEKFLRSAGQWTASRELDLRRLKPLLTLGADIAQTASEIAANSGRWIKLTEESARLVEEYGLMESKTPGVSHLMVGIPGKLKNWLQTEQGPGSILTNPAALSGIAGIMTQVAAQQTMAEITAYLAKIDEKVDDVLRKQDDAVVAHMIGSGFSIDSAMTVREATGGVNEVTWSKVQATSEAIGYTQGYALLQLKALAEKFERKTSVSGIAKTALEAESEVREWLAVLARCVQLQTGLEVLELDRVLEVFPEKLADHRRGLRMARQEQLELISRCTEHLLDRIDAAVGLANVKMLRSLTKSLAVVESGNQLATGVNDFHGLLGIEADLRSWEARDLGPFAEKGAQAIQVTKDKGPLVVVVGALAVAALRFKKP